MKDKKCRTKECKNLINSKMNKSRFCGKCCHIDYREDHRQEIRNYTKNYMKKYRKEKKKEIRKSAGKYYLNNKESFRRNGERYYKNNTEKQKAQSKKYYEANKKERARYFLEYANKRYKDDEGFRMRKRLGSSLGKVIRYYIKTGKICNPMPELRIDWKGIIKVLTLIPNPRSAYHVDHIIPLYKFDLTDWKQIHIAFAPKNHRWLLIKDNLTRDKPNMKWRQKSK